MLIKKNFIQCKSGFLLLEAAIFIGILSVISIFGAKSYKSYISLKNHQLECKNKEMITHAIASYVSTNYRLPYPASSMDDGTEIHGQKCGFVPYKNLGISKKDVIFGSGKPMIYIPESNLTKNFSSIFASDKEEAVASDEPGAFCEITNQSIKLDTANENMIAFVLIDSEQSTDEEKYIIKTNKNTYWITRNILLSKYVKCGPCIIKKSTTKDIKSQISID